MAIQIFINEPSIGLTDQSDRIWYGAQTSFSLIQKQRGTASIVFEVAAGDSYSPTVGCPIYVHEITDGPTDTIVYAGKIQTIEKKWIGNDGDVTYTLTCVSLEACFDTIRITPPRQFNGHTAGEIITLLFNSLCAGVPVTLGTIDLTAGGVLPSQVYRNDRLSDVFTSLATLAGTDIIWGVLMADQSLYFRGSTTVPAPFVLESYLFETGDYKVDETDYRNRQLIQGSFLAFSTANEMFDGDNISQTFQLREPVDRITTAMLTTGTQATATGVFGTLSPAAGGNPSPGDTFTITPPHSPPVVEDPYTFVASLDNTIRNQILIGVDANATCRNTVDAINGNPLVAGITYSLPTWPNDSCRADAFFIGPPPTFVLRVMNPGSGGNGVVLTSAPAVLSPFVSPAFFWEGATLSPLAPAQTTGGSDGTTNALQVGVASAGTLSNSVQYTPGSPFITLSAAVPGGASLSIAYYGLGRDTIAVEDSAAVAVRAAIEHGSGKYQQLITDTTNTDARSMYLEALQALTAFQTIPESFQFTIYQALLSPGQLLTITITSPTGAPALLDGVWLVQEIQAVIVEGVESLPEPYGHFQYTVTVINVNQISTFVEFWENLAIVTPAGAQTINNLSSISSTPQLAPTTPTDTTPPTSPAQGTPTTSAGQQWVQEAPGRYAKWKASDLVVDASDNTLVTSASRPAVSGDVGSIIVVISGTGWTVGEYAITSAPGGGYQLASSPAAVGTTGGFWALINDGLWCTTWNPSPSFTGNAVIILTLNGAQLDPFAPGEIGPVPGGGDYVLQKGNQILFMTPPDPSTAKLIATYFPAGITPAPTGPSATKIAVVLDVQATDFPQPYTPHVPPGSDRHFYDVAVAGGIQEAGATIAVTGTSDAGIVWSLVSSDAHTTDSRIGTLSASPNGPLKRIYTAPPVLPSTLTPPLSDIVVLGVQSHADSTAKAFNTITLTSGTPPVGGHYVAIAFHSSSTEQVMRSTDAITWTAISTPTDGQGGNCIANFGTDKFTALCLDSSGTTWIAITSTDGGATWTSHSIPQPNGQYVDLVFANGLLVGLDSGGVIITSTAGTSWTQTATVIGSNWKSIAFGAGVYVIIGGATSAVTIASSSDATTWNLQTPPVDPALFNMSSLCFGGGQFVSLGFPNFGGANSSMDSADGAAWLSFTTSPASNGSWGGLAFGAGIYFAANQDQFTGRTLSSTDGQAWASASNAGASDCNRVRFLNSLFVICRNDQSASAGNTIVTTPDGVTLTTQTTAIADFVIDVAFG